MSKLEKLENELNFALVTLNSFPIRGPLIIPVGKTMEAVSRALGMAQELRQEEAERAADEKAEEGKEEVENDAVAQHEVQ